MSLLDVDDIHTFYEHSHILQGVSMQAEGGRVTALLGRNGVGKTTLIRSVIGFTPPRTGSIRFAGEPIERVPSYRIARRGVGLVPQGRRVFPSLTVEENLRLGALPGRAGRWSLDTVYEMFPRLRDRSTNYGGQLSGGEQQMVAIGRALMSNPVLLLMDEPSEGLAPLIVRELERAMSLPLALAVADTAYIISKGRVVFHGDPQTIRTDGDVRTKYLGI
ncbi:MAG: ABC transporter ATP-binding protein [Vulcanimicrobiaceae bacterium]